MLERSVFRHGRRDVSCDRCNAVRADRVQCFGQRGPIGRKEVVPHRGRPGRVDDFQYPAITSIIFAAIDMRIDRRAAVRDERPGGISGRRHSVGILPEA